MREWLSGGAPPCQGGGRGFDPRLALGKKNDTKSVSFFFFERWSGLESSISTLRSGPRSPRSPGPRAPSRACLLKPAFPFSWCIRYKQKRRLHFVAAAFLLIVCLLFDFIRIFDAVDPDAGNRSRVPRRWFRSGQPPVLRCMRSRSSPAHRSCRSRHAVPVLLPHRHRSNS